METPIPTTIVELLKSKRSVDVITYDHSIYFDNGEWVVKERKSFGREIYRGTSETEAVAALIAEGVR